MTALARNDGSRLGRWWFTVDRWMLATIALLIVIGMLSSLAASPAVAERIGLDAFAFVRRQMLFLPLAAALMVAVSFVGLRSIRRLALVGFVVSLALTFAAPLIGPEIKGARRWISLPGISLQPSEFLKPCFTVVTGWLFAEGVQTRDFPAAVIASVLLGVVLVGLKLQPDIGMAAVVLAVFLAQWFVAGLRIVWVVLLSGLVAAAAVAAYMLFPHVQSRVARFLDPSVGDTYQIDRALEAFAYGGLVGRGPGEGRVKSVLPDAHADFVFAVLGEEFGMLVCLFIIALFAFIVLRALFRLMSESDPFVILAGSGLAMQFGLQAFINMGSTLHLIPTKGMTLPFISYGGSSVFAIALGLGMLLALTRKRTRSDAP